MPTSRLIMFQQTSFLPALFAGLVLSVVGGQARAAATIPERLQEEASRPMRWIVESAKLDRRKDSGDGDTPAPKARPRPVERAARAIPNDITAAEGGDAGYKEPAMRHTSVVREARVENKTAWVPTVREAERPLMPRAAGELVAKWTPPPSPSPTPMPAERASVADDLARLVPISQAPPVVWRGFCGADCGKYFYRISFKVKPDGRVDTDSIRLIESNYPKLKRAVLDAVATWRYMPMQASVDEEVTLRISGQ